MWILNTLSNNYANPVSIGYVVLSNNSFQSNAVPILVGQRTISIAIPYIGTMYFQDIGDKPLGPSTKTWGVLISLNTDQWVFRYEGTGQINVTINQDGSIFFTSPTGGDINKIA